MPADLELLERWAAGEREAGDELVRRHYQTVFTFFHLRVTAVADDLTQTTFLACVEAAARVRRADGFKAFLFGIARHKLLDYLRHRRVEGTAVEAGEFLSTEPSLSVSRIVAYQEEQRLLLRAMQELPIDSQIALDLFYWQGLSNAEIGTVLDLPTSTVTTRLSRARQTLQRTIEVMRAPERPRGSLLSDFERWARSLRPAD